VILLVLVTVLLAAFMLTKFVQRATTELLADARAGDQAQMRREAYSALETTLAVLADVRAADHALYSPAQGWDRPLDYAGYEPADGMRVEVAFQDESGRISLPKADAATLEALFVLTGVDRNQAERASDALLVWMHPDYVPPTLEADPGNYERGVLPHRAARRPLRSLAELASVAVVRDLLFDDAGQPNERYRQFAAAVSLQAFERVNLNAASPEALAVAGLGTGSSSALRDHLRTGPRPYFRGMDEATAALGAPVASDRFGVEIQVLRIDITVRDGGRLYRLSAVVAPGGGVVTPPRTAPAGDNLQTATPAVQKTPVTLKKLDYPFKVLELLEDVESPPLARDENPAAT
jgi:general secretion pathway protein K